MDEVTVKFTGKITYEKEISVVRAVQVIAFIENGSETVDFSEGRTAIDVPIPRTGIDAASPTEALAVSGARTNPQKIVALGQYSRSKNESRTFDPNVVKKMFPKLGLRTPQNFNRDLKEAISLGYIYEDEQHIGEYQITPTGEGAILSKFEGVEQSFKPKKATTRGKKRNSTIRQEVQDLEINAELDGFKDYHDLSKTDKFLWLLNYAKANGVKSLSPVEISYLAKRLNDNIPTTDMTSYIKSRKKHVTKNSDGTLNILKTGIDSLRV